MYDEEKVHGYEWTKEGMTEVAEAASVQMTDIEDLLQKYK